MLVVGLPSPRPITDTHLYSTPETFDIVSKTVDVAGRKNLAQISKIVTQIASGTEFGEDTPEYLPINQYVRKAIAQMSSWLIEGGLLELTSSYCLGSALTVTNVLDAESQFHAHEFLDATVQPKPIYISPNEVYAMHALLSQYLDDLVHLLRDRSVLFTNSLLGSES